MADDEVTERMAAARTHLRGFRPILWSRTARVIAAGTGDERPAADVLATFHVDQLAADSTQIGPFTMIRDTRPLVGHIAQLRRERKR